MSLEKIAKNYELLVRFNDDGKVGAHLQTLTGIVENGELIAPPQLGELQQLTLPELKTFVDGLSEADWFVSETDQ